MTTRPSLCRPYQVERSVTFKAWRNSSPVDPARLADATTFDEAIEALTPAALHRMGDRVVAILRHDAGKGTKTLALYGFKRSTKHYTYRASQSGGSPVREGRIEPFLMHAEDVLAYQPVEPFDAFRDCPVGADRTLVEGVRR